ncbi:MAG: hypothetical protein V7697_18535 [Rhodococcus erythropolis]
MNDKYVDRYQAAERLNRTPRTIARWVKEHKIDTIGSGRNALYAFGDLLAVRNELEANSAEGKFGALRQPEYQGRRPSSLRPLIAAKLAEGLPKSVIARNLGCSRTLIYAVERGEGDEATTVPGE